MTPIRRLATVNDDGREYVFAIQIKGPPAIMYEIALSFAREQRQYVESVALALQSRGIAVFYDEFDKVKLWGKDLGEELQVVYELKSDYVVFFVSQAWVDRAWPRHERRTALSRAVKEPKEYVLPVRFDDTPVPGLSESVQYLRADEYSPAELASVIAQKLGVSLFEGKASEVPAPRMTSLVGEAVFDYSNHDGRYVIGRGTLSFETKWSKASNTSIHVYNDPPSINGVALAPLHSTSIQQVVSAESFNYTSRVRTPRVGQIVVFRNVNGFYAAVQPIVIKDDTRGDDHDELRFQYAIQDDGTGNFAAFGSCE